MKTVFLHLQSIIAIIVDGHSDIEIGGFFIFIINHLFIYILLLLLFIYLLNIYIYISLLQFLLIFITSRN